MRVQKEAVITWTLSFIVTLFFIGFAAGVIIAEREARVFLDEMRESLHGTMSIIDRR